MEYVAVTYKSIKGHTVNIAKNRRKYNCNMCDSFITMSPVYLSVEKGFICGYCYQYKRHFLEEGEILLPQKLYQDFAFNLRFPCEFCEYFSIFDSPMASHEIQCKKRIFKCPLSSLNRFFVGDGENCEWEDLDGKKMVPHVMMNHQELLISKPFELAIEELKRPNEEIRIFLVPLTNRRLVAILTEYDEGENVIVLRCRSNKPGYPIMNTHCHISFRISDDDSFPNTLNVYPLGARVMEQGIKDSLTLYLNRLEPEEVVQFGFEPSPPEKGLIGNIELDFATDHDYWY